MTAPRLTAGPVLVCRHSSGVALVPLLVKGAATSPTLVLITLTTSPAKADMSGLSSLPRIFLTIDTESGKAWHSFKHSLSHSTYWGLSSNLRHN